MKKTIILAFLGFAVILPLSSFALVRNPSDYGYDSSTYDSSTYVNPALNSRNNSSGVPTLGGSCSSISSLDGLVGCIVSGLKIVVYLLFTFAFIYTLYGAFNFIRAEGDKRDDWRSVMINGIIGLFVMSSIWGIVGILDGTFNLSGVSPITPPEIRL